MESSSGFHIFFDGQKAFDIMGRLVGDTGFESVTSTVYKRHKKKKKGRN
jgi:hypothetical protein